MAKKLKTVFAKNEIFHAFISGQYPEGKTPSRNVFFDNTTVIYSYGRHYPLAFIAKRYEDNKNIAWSERPRGIILMNQDNYSSTTNDQKSWMRYAIPKDNYLIFDVKDPEISSNDPLYTHKVNLHWYGVMAKASIGQAEKALSKAGSYLSQAWSHINEAANYIEAFDLREAFTDIRGISISDFSHNSPTFDGKDLIAFAELIEAKAKARSARANDPALQEKREKERERRQAGKAEAEARANAEALQEWKSGKRYWLSHKITFAYLRLNMELMQVQTSKGVNLSIEKALELYKIVCRLTAEGGKEDIKGIKIKDENNTIFMLDSVSAKGDIKAGCHTIPNAEIQYIASLLNW